MTCEWCTCPACVNQEICYKENLNFMENPKWVSWNHLPLLPQCKVTAFVYSEFQYGMGYKLQLFPDGQMLGNRKADLFTNATIDQFQFWHLDAVRLRDVVAM